MGIATGRGRRWGWGCATKNRARQQPVICIFVLRSARDKGANLVAYRISHYLCAGLLTLFFVCTNIWLQWRQSTTCRIANSLKMWVKTTPR